MTDDTRLTPAAAAAMLETMAGMQEAHNVQVHPDWRTNGYEYYRAIWVECAEMLDHFGWKWWKQQTPDLAQVKLELVDIWHFALSEMLRADTLDAGVAEQLAALAVPETGDADAFRLAIEAMAADALATRSFTMAPFLAAMETLPMGYEELFAMYIGKNVLNHFRQDHGYKDGSYRKLWQGREDNEHLVEALAALDCAPAEVPDRLYAELARRYGEA